MKTKVIEIRENANVVNLKNMIIREEDKEKLKRYIYDFDELIKDDRFWDLIDELDDLTADDIVNHGDYPSDAGFEMEKLRDHIYYDNIDNHLLED